jgi:hypothetical protein
MKLLGGLSEKIINRFSFTQWMEDENDNND